MNLLELKKEQVIHKSEHPIGVMVYESHVDVPPYKLQKSFDSVTLAAEFLIDEFSYAVIIEDDLDPTEHGAFLIKNEDQFKEAIEGERENLRMDGYDDRLFSSFLNKIKQVTVFPEQQRYTIRYNWDDLSGILQIVCKPIEFLKFQKLVKDKY